MELFSERVKFYAKNTSLYKLEKKGFNAAFFQQLTQPYFTGLNIDTIIDIGANEGQSTITFRTAFPKAIIHAFEPLPVCYEKLLLNLKEFSDIRFYNTALGAEEGEISFEQNEYSASSSALQMTSSHVSNFPYTKNKEDIKVRVETLDNVFSHLEHMGVILVKIDVQGYEKHVIEGGIKTLKTASVVIVETSFETLYTGQPLFGEIYNVVSSLGFKYAGSFDQLKSPQTGKILQQDAIFVKG